MLLAVACGTRSDVRRRCLRTQRTRRTACARVADGLCAFEDADGVTVTSALRGDALDALGRSESPSRMGSREEGRSAAREAVRGWRGRARADARRRLREWNRTVRGRRVAPRAQARHRRVQRRSAPPARTRTFPATGPAWTSALAPTRARGAWARSARAGRASRPLPPSRGRRAG
jgi:hypothetical protein